MKKFLWSTISVIVAFVVFVVLMFVGFNAVFSIVDIFYNKQISATDITQVKNAIDHKFSTLRMELLLVYLLAYLVVYWRVFIGWRKWLTGKIEKITLASLMILFSTLFFLLAMVLQNITF